MDNSSRKYHYEEQYHTYGDESPILSYRYEKYKSFSPYTRSVNEEVKKRSTFSILAKFFLFSSAVILFCVLMYIPVYSKANKSNRMPKAIVSGWSRNSNRDTKLYVRPLNVTTLHEPTNICTDKLYLLIIVCSATNNFDQRQAIRQTWGNYTRYKEISKVSFKIREKYKKYNYTYDLVAKSKSKRDVAALSKLLPQLAEALKENINKIDSDVPEKRFDDEMLPEFDMNKEIGEQTENYDYNFESNVMRIPPRGYEDNPDLEKVMSLLKQDKDFLKYGEKFKQGNTEVDYKLAFILGLPANDNSSGIQGRIEEEIEKYGDIIQEDFIDSYNNLTLKSIMMLKWLNNKCKDKVRYILKTDDDMYINVVNLVNSLHNRSKEFDVQPSKSPHDKEYLLVGDLICGARPVQDSKNKWYSPRYMYNGRVYPKYLSGTGYVMSIDTAVQLYRAALNTNYFHLEDIYITGMCAIRATPLMIARDDPLFSYSWARDVCAAHSRVTAHHVAPAHMRTLDRLLTHTTTVDKCEHLRLTEVKPQNHSTYVVYKYVKLHRVACNKLL